MPNGPGESVEQPAGALTGAIDPKLLEDFRTESSEMLETLERVLLALDEGEADATECIHELFRIVHNVKGTARWVEFGDVAEIAHAGEDVLQRMRSGRLRPSKPLIGWLLALVDALREAIGAAFRDLGAQTTGPTSAAGGLGAATAPSAGPRNRERQTARVELTELQSALDLVGELGVALSEIEHLLEKSTTVPDADRADACHRVDGLLGSLRELVVGLRLAPLEPLLRSFERTVRDVAQKAGKRVRLAVDATGANVDALVIEKLRDPLSHMLRNAVDHGIEPPEERTARGKDPSGLITISARRNGGQLEIQVSDDGRGVDRATIAAKLRQRGFAQPELLSDQQLLATIFEAGFSTARQITEISGRGVGMDVVHTNVEALGGSIVTRSEPGTGTTFTVTLPQVVGMVRGIRVVVGDETVILPADEVLACATAETVRSSESESNHSASPGVAVFDLHGTPVSLIALRSVLGIAGGAPRRQSVVVVRHGSRRVGLLVDRVEGERHLLVKSLGPLFGKATWVSGGTIAGTGRVGLVLDVARLVAAVQAS